MATEQDQVPAIPLDQEPENSLQRYREVFDLCDKDGKGFVSKEELSHICLQVSDEEVASSVLDNVMLCLDSDHDGNISFEEFKAGFQAFQRLHSEAEPCSTPGPGSTPHKLAVEEVYESEPVVDEEEGAWREVAERIDPQGALARTGVGAVWKEMNRRDPALVENFEGFLTEVISELRQSDLEKSTLQNHVKRIMEQHSREVTEMDYLLQEELQQAKVSQQQASASRTSRLSSQYSSMLAEREAVIEELATHELDLKRALQEKAHHESELRQQKHMLMTANKVLQKKLETNGSESEPHSRELSEEGGSGSGEGSPASDHRPVSQVDAVMDREEEEDGEAWSGVMGSERRVMTSPDAGLRLNVTQETSDTEQEHIKYFPPKKSTGLQSTGNTEDRTIQTQESLARRDQLTAEYEGSGLDALREVRESSAESTQLPRTPPQVRTSSSSSSHDIIPAAAAAAAVASGSSGKGGGGGGGQGRSAGSTGARMMADSLTISGVMPRRNELPSPPSSTSHQVSRVFKVIFLGESGVGKTSLIAFLTDGKFSPNVNSTVGLDYSIKMLRVGEERVVFQLWDTAGQERFNNTLTPVYFRRADAFVIVYDVTNLSSFQATRKWISVIKAALREQPPVIMLVGNKSDKQRQRCVTSEDGRTLALELQAMFSETSALSGDNVLQAHSTLARLLLARENADLQEIKKNAVAENSEKSRCGC